MPSFQLCRPENSESPWTSLQSTPHFQSAGKSGRVSFQNVPQIWPLFTTPPVTALGQATTNSCLDHGKSFVSCLSVSVLVPSSIATLLPSLNSHLGQHLESSWVGLGNCSAQTIQRLPSHSESKLTSSQGACEARCDLPSTPVTLVPPPLSLLLASFQPHRPPCSRPSPPQDLRMRWFLYRGCLSLRVYHLGGVILSLTSSARSSSITSHQGLPCPVWTELHLPSPEPCSPAPPLVYFSPAQPCRPVVWKGPERGLMVCAAVSQNS